MAECLFQRSDRKAELQFRLKACLRLSRSNKCRYLAAKKEKLLLFQTAEQLEFHQEVHNSFFGNDSVFYVIVKCVIFLQIFVFNLFKIQKSNLTIVHGF